MIGTVGPIYRLTFRPIYPVDIPGSQPDLKRTWNGSAFHFEKRYVVFKPRLCPFCVLNREREVLFART